MAPIPTDPRINKISYARMVQPALPVLPRRSKATEPKNTASAQSESEKVGTTSVHPPAAQEDTRANVESEVIASPKTPQTDTSPAQQVEDESIVSTVSPGPHPASDDKAPTDLTEEVASSEVVGEPSDEEKELAVQDNDVKPDNESELALSENIAEEPSKAEVNTGVEGASNEPVGLDDGQSQYPVSSSPLPTAATGEPQQDTSESQGRVAQTVVHVVDESAGATSPFTPTDNGTHSSEQPRSQFNDNATQGSGPAEISEQNVNGYPQPMTATSSQPLSFPGARTFNALAPLQEHLLLLSHTKEGVDYAIQVTPPGVQPFVAYSHSVLMLRSPRLRKLMQRQPNSTYSGNFINLYPACFVLNHAFEAALRFLYSDTVLSNDFFVQPHPGADFHAARLHNLEYILSYWVAGIELGIEQVCVCAERLLSNYLDWDILEITYKRAWDLVNTPATSSGKSIATPDYVVASNSVIRMILRFLAARMDIGNFKLDVNSSSVHFHARLPSLDDGRSRHNPALASMVFGSMPSSADISPASPQFDLLPTASTFRDTVASNILLNVDFENLCLFKSFVRTEKSLDDSVFYPFLSAIIGERESRRLKVLSARSVPTKDRGANSTAWDAVGWREYLEGGWIQRERVEVVPTPH